MQIDEITAIVGGQVVCGEDRLVQARRFECAFASDLMSDVLTFDREDLLLITGLCNLQAIRTAEISDIQTIVFARGKKVSPEMLELAEENKMVLIECSGSLYRISGLLYEAGLKPVY